jgi:hypothetical protein
MKLGDPFNALLRTVVIGILSLGLTLNIWWTINIIPAAATIGAQAVPILSSEPRSLVEVLVIEMVVDFLVSFGLLFSIWFLWRQGRSLRREKGRSMLQADRFRVVEIVVVAVLCALPLSYYVTLVKSKFHSGLAETPAEAMESFLFSLTACAIALGGIVILGRFWPTANPDSPQTLGLGANGEMIRGE